MGTIDPCVCAEQARKQCRLALRMAEIVGDLAKCQLEMIDSASPLMVDMIGHQSHAWIEALGDLVNSVDAATPEDEQAATPVFKGARRMFPLEQKDRRPCRICPDCGEFVPAGWIHGCG